MKIIMPGGRQSGGRPGKADYGDYRGRDAKAKPGRTHAIVTDAETMYW